MLNKYIKEIEFLECVKRQMQLGQITVPERAEQFKNDEIMYEKIISILKEKDL